MALGRHPYDSKHALHDLVIRYLKAFGPASIKDLQYWSGLTGLAAVVHQCSSELVTYSDHRGVTLFDIAQGPFPPTDLAAPTRLLLQYDNVLYSHADRTRILPEQYRRIVSPSGKPARATFLVDGQVAGTWRYEKTALMASLILEPFRVIPANARDELHYESARVLRFIAPNRRQSISVMDPRC